MNSANLESLRDQLREFALEREWDQFHSPKNLAIALSVEVSELLEHFQWLTEKDSYSPPLEEVSKEIGDVLLYLIRLADKLDINLIEAAHFKLVENAKKYPIEKSRGSNKKYTDL
jgi:dCTP diphosphatase